MSIDPKCCMCPKELNEFGAILLSPPEKDIVYKFHICNECYLKMLPKLEIYDCGEDIKDGWYNVEKELVIEDYELIYLTKVAINDCIKITKVFLETHVPRVRIQTNDNEYTMVKLFYFRKGILPYIRKLTPDELTIKDIIE